MEYVNLYLTDLLYALSWLLNTNTISEITFFFLKKSQFYMKLPK
jgi:hypothetical protein